MTGETEAAGAPAEPIDAEFEAASPPKGPKRPRTGASPGWVALILSSVAAAAAGGVFGAMAGGRNAGDFAPSAVVDDLDDAASSARDNAARLDRLSDALAAAEQRFDLEMQSVAAASGDTEGLDETLEEVRALAERFESEVDAVAFATLEARITSIENADLSDEASSPRLMNRAVTALRDRVDSVEAASDEAVVALQTRGEAIADLTARLTAIETEISSINARIEVIAEGDQSDDAARLIEELEARTAQTDAARLAADTALALSSIEALSLRGRPFPAAYEKLSAAYPTDPAVAALEDAAQRGAPTPAQLSAAFEQTADAALEAEAQASQADGWGWVRRAFGDAVNVRPSDASDSPLGGAITAARDALNADDLAQAVGALSALPEPASEMFAGWSADAERRIALDAALIRLNSRFTER